MRPTGFRIATLTILLLIFIPARLWSQEDTPAERKIEEMARRFGGRLGIKQHVVVRIASGNTRLASVENVQKDHGTYRIQFDDAFLRTLDDRDLNAAVAHEMGHVWIYTHFPFLQTESLANRQALKLVPRSDLERVYRKVWKWRGKSGNLAEVMDPAEPTDTTHEGK